MTGHGEDEESSEMTGHDEPNILLKTGVGQKQDANDDRRGQLRVSDDGLERDVVLRHAGRDAGEDARAILHCKADEIAAFMALDLAALVGLELRGRPSEARNLLRAGMGLGDVGDIAHHGRSRGIAAGAGAHLDAGISFTASTPLSRSCQ